MSRPLADLRHDLRRYNRGPQPLTLGRRWRIASLPGVQAVVVYRAGRWLASCLRLPWLWPLLLLAPLYWLARGWVLAAYDIDLHPSAEIGAGLFVGHAGGVRVAACRLGESCAIQQEVRLLPAPGTREGPRIGDRVWIGAHATVIGSHVVGDGATISAGAVVTGDIAPRSMVMGDPARVVRWDFDNSEFL